MAEVTSRHHQQTQGPSTNMYQQQGVTQKKMLKLAASPRSGWGFGISHTPRHEDAMTTLEERDVGPLSSRKELDVGIPGRRGKVPWESSMGTQEKTSCSQKNHLKIPFFLVPSLVLQGLWILWAVFGMFLTCNHGRFHGKLENCTFTSMIFPAN